MIVRLQSTMVPISQAHPLKSNATIRNIPTGNLLTPAQFSESKKSTQDVFFNQATGVPVAFLFGGNKSRFKMHLIINTFKIKFKFCPNRKRTATI